MVTDGSSGSYEVRGSGVRGPFRLDLALTPAGCSADTVGGRGGGGGAAECDGRASFRMTGGQSVVIPVRLVRCFALSPRSSALHIQQCRPGGTSLVARLFGPKPPYDLILSECSIDWQSGHFIGRFDLRVHDVYATTVRTFGGVVETTFPPLRGASSP